MALYWTEDLQDNGAGESTPSGEWRDGADLPYLAAGGRLSMTSLIHDFVLTLLDLRPVSAPGPTLSR